MFEPRSPPLPAIGTTHSYIVGKGYSVHFTYTGAAIDAAWSPKIPPMKVARKLLPAYRRARARFIRKINPTLGSILVVEL